MLDVVDNRSDVGRRHVRLRRVRQLRGRVQGRGGHLQAAHAHLAMAPAEHHRFATAHSVAATCTLQAVVFLHTMSFATPVFGSDPCLVDHCALLWYRCSLHHNVLLLVVAASRSRSLTEFPRIELVGGCPLGACQISACVCVSWISVGSMKKRAPESMLHPDRSASVMSGAKPY